MTWRTAYSHIIDCLDALASNARTTLCGFFACVDATVSLDQAEALLEAADSAEAVQFADVLLQRAQAGIGGEIRVDWPAVPHGSIAGSRSGSTLAAPLRMRLACSRSSAHRHC